MNKLVSITCSAPLHCTESLHIKAFQNQIKEAAYLNVLTLPAVRAHSGLCTPSGRVKFQAVSCTPSPGLNTTWMLTPSSVFTLGLTTQPEGPGSSSEDNEVIGTGFISPRVNPLTVGNALMSIMKKKILKCCYTISIYQQFLTTIDCGISLGANWRQHRDIFFFFSVGN